MIKHCCKEITENIERPEVAIAYDDKFREYGIAILDGGTAQQRIQFCPWCGSSLPESLREDWFDLIFDKYNLDGPEDPRIPKEMRTGDWWRKDKKR